MIVTRLFFITLLFALAAFGATAQISPDSVFRKNDLIKDLYSLKSTILESHPNPYAFCTEEEFREAFGKAIEKIDGDMPLKEYVRIVEQAMVVMRDSHSGLDYGHLQKMQIEHKNSFLPFRVHSYGPDLYIEADRDTLLPKGAKIVCIDNQDARALYQPAIYYAHIEGNSLTSQRRIADAVFPYLSGLYYNFPDTVKIDIEPFGKDTIETYTTTLYTKSQWDERQKRFRTTALSRAMNLDFYAHDSVAVLKIGTFAPGDKKKYRKFIKASFELIAEKNVQLLALDLRDNGGGQSSNVEYLYSFIDKKGYNTPSNIIGKASTLAKSRSKIQKSNFTLWMLRTFYKKDEDVRGFLRLQNLEMGQLDTVYFKDPVVQKEQYVYDGKAVLFINGLTASASVDFTNAFLKNERGEVLGESCMGPKTGTFGNPTTYTLPLTEIKVSISTIRYNYDDSFIYEEKPLKPTIEVPLLPEHLATGTDPCLNYTLQKLF